MVTAVIQGNNSAAELPEIIKGTRILLLIVTDKIPLNSACQQKKKPNAQLTEHYCYYKKSAKTRDVGMYFHQKTLPQKPMKQAIVHTTMHAQTTHTSQCNAFTA